MLLKMVHVSENYYSHVPVSIIEKITMYLLLYPSYTEFSKWIFFYIYDLSSQIDY